jgi:hypothetical protein
MKAGRVNRVTETYGPDLWRQGTRGAESAAVSQRAYLENMQVYRTGLLGPRPWMRRQATADLLLTGFASSGAVVDSQRGIWLTKTAPDSSFPAELTAMVVITNDANVRMKINHWTGNGGEPGWSTPSMVPNMLGVANDSYMGGMPLLSAKHEGPSRDKAIFGRDIVRFSHGAFMPYTFNAARDTWPATGMPDPPDPTAGRVHQSRGFWWKPFTVSAGPEATYVAYSNPYDYHQAASVAQYLQMDQKVFGVFPTGSTLLVVGLEGSWFSLNGRGNPADATLLNEGRQRRPAHFQGVCEMDGDLYFIAQDRKTPVIVKQGGDLDDESLQHLHLPGFFPGTLETMVFRGLASGITNCVFLPHCNYTNATTRQGLNTLSFVNNVWTTDWYTSYASDYAFENNMDCAISPDGDHLVFASIGQIPTTDTVQVRFATRDVYLGRPSKSSDRWSGRFETAAHFDSASDRVSYQGGTVALPRMPARDYEKNRVRNVIVDAVYWKDAADAYAPVQVWCHVQDGNGNDTSLRSTYPPGGAAVAALPNAEGGPIRIEFSPDDGLPFTHFSEVRLQGIHSLAIERVIVEYEFDPGSPTL